MPPSSHIMIHHFVFNPSRESQRKKYEPTENVAPGLGVTARGFCLLGWTQSADSKENIERTSMSGLVKSRKGNKKGDKSKDKVACKT